MIHSAYAVVPPMAVSEGLLQGPIDSSSVASGCDGGDIGGSSECVGARCVWVICVYRTSVSVVCLVRA